MSYDLCFSPEFFLAEGEPYDSDRGPSFQPTSVWQAICSMNRVEWARVAETLGVEAEYLTAETVLEAVHATNTCSNLNSPVEVWIDAAGDCRLYVY